MKKIAILASHNGSGFDAIYDAVSKQTLDAEIAFVISNNSKAKVLDKAKAHEINHYVINSKVVQNPDQEIYNLLQKHSIKYIFLSGYMKKLSTLLTQNFTIINSHPSLLPKFGGSGMYGRLVHEAVIKNNETKSGVTIHKVNEHYDEGEILLQKELLLEKDETVETLEMRIKALEAIAIVESLKICLK